MCDQPKANPCVPVRAFEPSPFFVAWLALACAGFPPARHATADEIVAQHAKWAANGKPQGVRGAK